MKQHLDDAQVATMYRNTSRPSCAPFFAGLFAICFSLHQLHAQTNLPQTVGENTVPSFKDILQLPGVGSPRISPDGSTIAFAKRTVDWEDNRFESEIWLVRPGDTPFQLTRTKDGSSNNPAWSPDSTRIAFAADRGDKNQVFIINASGGEAWQLTDARENITGFRWSPDGTRIAYTCNDETVDEDNQREEEYGKYEVEDNEYRMTHLWIMDASEKESEPVRLTEGREFTVGSFEFSPDGTKIAFDHRPNPLINSIADANISVINLDDKKVQLLVDRAGPDSGPVWSPDGKSILFGTSQQDLSSFFYLNRELAIVDIKAGDVEVLTSEFDENPGGAEWNSSGIYFNAFEKTALRLFRLDPVNRKIEMDNRFENSVLSFEFAEDGKTLVVQSDSVESLPELFLLSGDTVEQVTAMTDLVQEWALGRSEVISWKSLDGSQIEGVLYKPDDFDASKKYPLLVIIHGGPTGISRPAMVNTYVYPIHQWLAKGAIVLMPNYRGSAGYGEKFRSLNVRNLGVGDMWDVMSGVEHLVDQGLADPDRMGAMGWSQGGYISAFLTTNTDRFHAISVGAGISNWMTYYVNTDIHPFTRQYLKANPWDDPNIYAKTSPMTNIRNATTPTLIQHGEFDRRVPIPNARELFQGLQDNDVPAQLIVYKGFGHGITKPKERLAAIWHNWQWFSRYLWEEEVEMPLPDKDDKNDEAQDDDSDEK